MARNPGRMTNIGNKTKKRTDIELADNEANLLLTTQIDWEALRPKITDQEVYDRLIAIVEEATQNNVNLAQLKSRLKTLGKEGLAVAEKVVKLIS